METEYSSHRQNTHKNRLLWLGTMLMVAGTFSFSNYEKFGDVFTLIGALIILGSCYWIRRMRKS